MKTIYSMILVLILSMTSCTKFLDVKPTDSITPASYFETEVQLKFALAAVYDVLGTTYGSVMLYRYGLEADEGYYVNAPAAGVHAYNFTSSDPSIETYWALLYGGISRANLLLDNVDKNPALNEAFRGQIRGEALFLRSYYYFLLVQTFGEVPLVLKSISSPNQTDLAKSSIAEVYDQILKDMITSEKLVAKIRALGYGGAVNKSAVRGMLARVCLYMAGYPLNDKSKYADAANWAKQVIDDPEASHSLNPDFSTVFINYAKDIYDVNESIWEIEYWGNRSGGFSETGQTGTVNGPSSTNPETGVGSAGLRVTRPFYSSFEDGDLRRDFSIANFTYNATGPSGAKTFITTTTAASIYNRFSGKFRREYEVVLPKANTVTPINFPLMRFSDILLMYAEAENEVKGNPSQGAIDAVNLVRRRAWSKGGIKSITLSSGGSGYTVAPVVTITGGSGKGAEAIATIAGGKITNIALSPDAITGKKIGSDYTMPITVSITGGGGTGASASATAYQIEEADVTALQKSSQLEFRKLIQIERSRELSFESLRKPDLIRWGIFVPVMHTTGSIIQAEVPTAVYIQRYLNVLDKHRLWPIPERELSINRALKQSTDWGL